MMSWKDIAIFISVLVFLAFVGDQILGLMGYPSAREIQIAHPHNFHERRKNIEYEYDFRTNSQGFRYKDIPLEKPKSEWRFLVLGDSFTEGMGVQEDETFSARLEHYFGRIHQGTVRFINGGLAGTGPLQYWRSFYFAGLKYNPDVVLICIYANDVSNTPERVIHEDLYRIYTRDYASKKPGITKVLHGLFPRTYTMLSLIKEQLFDAVKGPENFVERVIQRAKNQGVSDENIIKWTKSLDEKLVKAVNMGEMNGNILSFPLLRPRNWRNAIDVDTLEAERQFQAMSFVLDEILRVARNNGARVGLIFIPARWQYEPGVHESDHPWVKAGMVRKSWLRDQSEIQERLERWTGMRAVPFLDLTASFREESKHGKPLNYELDGHWNSAGHIVAAMAIKGWIEELNLSGFLGN